MGWWATRFCTFVCVCAIALTCVVLPAHAFTISSDPQYIVMNFAEINELDWASSESRWQITIKPKIVAELNQLRAALPQGTTQRKLAWSTLQEYMNFPMDTPSENAPYAIKMRRILEIAEEENFPVFLPLNGFQWWDELPELYNWWDPDGTHTPDSFFARQRTADFKQRFIAGYNPQNQWNVEWQDPNTPMNLNYRNWGGGGFRLAPPPNLMSARFRSMQKQRLEVMLKELTKVLDRWEQEGKSELFAGITIGTEVSLNASATPADEFRPYGYRATQDLVCPIDTKNCAIPQSWSEATMQQYRTTAVQHYLTDITRFAARLGIPKQRIYTHVWAESEEGDKRYAPYADAAVTKFSRPGVSLYGYAEEPQLLKQWDSMLSSQEIPTWGAVEYSAGTKESAWRNGLIHTLNAEQSAKVMVIYNWTQHKDTGAIPALREALSQDPKTPSCEVPEILVQPQAQPQQESAPSALQWSYLNTTPLPSNAVVTLHISSKLDASDEIAQEQLDSTSQSFTPSPTLKPGVYTWYLTLDGCDGEKRSVSQPQAFTIPITVEAAVSPLWQRAATLIDRFFR